MTTLPLAFLVVLGYSRFAGAQDPERFAANNRWTLTLIEGGVVVGVLVLIELLGFALAIDPAEAAQRKQQNRDDQGDRV
jgi:hypothetical protein